MTGTHSCSNSMTLRSSVEVYAGNAQHYNNAQLCMQLMANTDTASKHSLLQ